jgi:uncharacterized membrane protein YtjA (UPF0391 family)
LFPDAAASERARQRGCWLQCGAPTNLCAALRGTFGRLGRFSSERHLNCTEATDMLGWAITFLVVAIIAAILGFGGVAIISVEIAKIIFFVAIVLFLISALMGYRSGWGRSP